MLRAAAAPTPPPPERGRGAGGGWGADIMRTWRQTAVRQATNEELIARFLRGCDLLEGRGRGRWRWSLVLGVGWRLMVLQGGDCGHRERPRKGNKVQKMMRSVVKFCLQHKCAGRRKVSVTGGKITFQKCFCDEEIHSFHHNKDANRRNTIIISYTESNWNGSISQNWLLWKRVISFSYFTHLKCEI